MNIESPLMHHAGASATIDGHHCNQYQGISLFRGKISITGNRTWYRDDCGCSLGVWGKTYGSKKKKVKRRLSRGRAGV